MASKNRSFEPILSAMSEVLQIPRYTYYYEAKERDNQEEELTKLVVKIFKDNRNVYEQRKIKVEPQKIGWKLSRRKIMKEQGLVSKYKIAQFKPTKSTVNESQIGNVLNREFNQEKELNVVVSDLTCVHVAQ